jgi:hypothetical protein
VRRLHGIERRETQLCEFEPRLLSYVPRDLVPRHLAFRSIQLTLQNLQNRGSTTDFTAEDTLVHKMYSIDFLVSFPHCTASKKLERDEFGLTATHASELELG